MGNRTGLAVMRARNILIISLGLNLLLGLLVFSQKKHQSPGPASVPPVQIVRQSVVEKITNAPAVSSIRIPAKSFTWENLESEDYPTYVANLRSVGCPERTLQHIIVQDLEKLYRDKQRQEPSETGLWMTGSDLEALRSKRAANKLALSLEKSAVMKALLGREIDREARKVWVEQAEPSWFLGYLTDDQCEQVLSIGMKMGRQLEASMGHNPLLIDSQVENVESSYHKMLEEFAKIASPQEIEEGVLRASLAMAFEGGGKLKSMKLSGEELHRLAALQKKEEDPFRKLMRMMQNGGEEGGSFSPAYVKDVRELLGDQRFVELVCAQDENLGRFRTAAGPTATPDTLVRVLEVQQATWEEMEKVKADETLSRSERRKQLRELQEMTKEAITKLGGKEAAEQYFKGQSR